jgi:hypothetical protein
VNGWVLAASAAAALSVSGVVAAAAGRYLVRAREGREAAGEHPVRYDDDEFVAPLVAPDGYRPRTWLVAGARVVHLEHGIGTVVTSPVAGGLVGVSFDDSTGRWCAPHLLDPLSAADERLLQAILARRPRLPLPAPRNDREDHDR